MPFPTEAKGQGQSVPSPSSPIFKTSSCCRFKGSVLGDLWPPTRPHRSLSLRDDQKREEAAVSEITAPRWQGLPSPPMLAQPRESARWKVRQESDSRTRGSLPPQENKLLLTKQFPAGAGIEETGFERRENADQGPGNPRVLSVCMCPV